MLSNVGETTAGKSTFLNLLLGMDVLATSVLSCTSVITTIRYGAKSCARVIFNDPGRADLHLNLDEDGLKQFRNFTFLGQDRDKDHGMQEVQLFLPSEILKVSLTKEQP